MKQNNSRTLNSSPCSSTNNSLPSGALFLTQGLDSHAQNLQATIQKCTKLTQQAFADTKKLLCHTHDRSTIQFTPLKSQMQQLNHRPWINTFNTLYDHWSNSSTPPTMNSTPQAQVTEAIHGAHIVYKPTSVWTYGCNLYKNVPRPNHNHNMLNLMTGSSHTSVC